MTEHHEEFPGNTFRAEYPIHAERITQSVQQWYELGVNQYIYTAPHLLRQTTANFIQKNFEQPDDVIVFGSPLSKALEYKRNNLLYSFTHMNPTLYEDTFAAWFNAKLMYNNNTDTRRCIEKTANTHIYNWLAQLPLNFKVDVGVWDKVDTSIKAAVDGKTEHIHPAATYMLARIQDAVIEQFISDVFAPEDLFGTSLN